MDDRRSSSLLSTFSVENPDEEAPIDHFTIPRKVHYHSNWKHDPDAVSWAKCPEHKIEACDFGRRNQVQYKYRTRSSSHSLAVRPLAPGNWTWNRDVKGNTTKDPGSSSFRKLERNSVSLVDKKPKCEIDLRVEGVLQDAILKDEKTDEQIHKKLEKLKIGLCKKSIRNDLKKNGDLIFSEESSRVIYEMGNLELIELRQTSPTNQCLLA